jgi:cell division protein ZipA
MGLTLVLLTLFHPGGDFVDIKDFILIAGGMLIAAVVAHGFWIAWRNRAEPLRLDIVPDLLAGSDVDDDLNRFRGELPNGGGRRVPPQQGDLLAAALADVSAPDDEYAGVPVLLEPGQSPRAAADRELLGTDVPARQRYERARSPQPQEPDLFSAKTSPEIVSGPTPEPIVMREATTARVAEVVLPGTPIVGEPLQPSANDPLPEVITTPSRSADAQYSPAEAASAKQQLRAQLRAQRQSAVTPPRGPSARESAARDSVRDKVAEKAKAKELAFQAAREASTLAAKEQAKAQSQQTAADLAEREAAQAARDAAPVEELIVLHLLAPTGSAYTGPALVHMLRAQGLKFGAMNIFHRVDPMTKARNYSVANAVEPGVFDLADLENFNSRGLSFFLQLPGPEDPLGTLDDMVHVVRTLAAELGGEVKDEGMSVLTGQTVAHLRQRISDHARKRLSRRA